MLKLRSIPIAVLVVFSAWLFASCADTSDFLVERTHPDGWNQASDDNFHGKFVLESADPAASCRSCHGQNYKGGTSGVSCATCHAAYPHPDGYLNPSSSGFHEAVFQDTRDWDITVCQQCHASDYGREIIRVQLGEPEISCLTCHTADDGPEDCATCHGGSENIAPPQDLFDGTATTEPGVGAHQQHLNAQTGAPVECTECHVVPAEFADAGHVLEDGTLGQTEIVFGALASHAGADPVYDFASSTCGSSYCHGGFVFAKADAGDNAWAYAEDFIRGNNPEVVWNAVGSGQAECGSCHALPPIGHIPAALSCATCHGAVVDGQNNIINPELHINGEKNLFQ